MSVHWKQWWPHRGGMTLNMRLTEGELMNCEDTHKCTFDAMLAAHWLECLCETCKHCKWQCSGRFRTELCAAV